MAQALDLGERRAVGADRGKLLSGLADWVRSTFDHDPQDLDLFRRALTHSSIDGEASYERLEFLGDRVLGLGMAEWLFELFPDEAEGPLSRRQNMLVSGAVCAEIAREIGAADQIRMGKGAYHNGVTNSEYVLGDVVESLLGALYLEAGLDAARSWIRRRWADRVHRRETVQKHPKAALQDWAAANKRGAPVYELIEESGPGHAPHHTAAVRLGAFERNATASTKREAETEAAKLLLADLLRDAPAKTRRKRPARPRTIVQASPKA